MKTRVNYDQFAWVTYTEPQIATFGLSTGQLEKRSMAFETLELNHEDDDRTIIDSGNGLTKLHVDSKGRILGGTMIASNAGEVVQELILAMTQKIPLGAFLSKVYPYPIQSRVNKRIVGNYMGRKLTPFAMRIMSFLY